MLFSGSIYFLLEEAGCDDLPRVPWKRRDCRLAAESPPGSGELTQETSGAVRSERCYLDGN